MPSCKHCLAQVIGFVLQRAFPPLAKKSSGNDFYCPALRALYFPTSSFNVPPLLRLSVPEGTGEFDVEQ